MSWPPCPFPVLRLTVVDSPDETGPRFREPVTTGVPFPAGMVRDLSTLRLARDDAAPAATQFRELERWPDGTIRWALLDFAATRSGRAGTAYDLALAADDTTAPADDGLILDHGLNHVQLTTGPTTFRIERGGSFPISSVTTAAGDVVAADGAGLEIATGGQTGAWTVDAITVVARGPVRAEIHVTATPPAGLGSTPLVVFARVEIFSSTPAARVHLTIRNRRRAEHPGGQWPLGDPGSIFLDAARVRIRPAGGITSAGLAIDPSTPAAAVTPPVTLLQASSGGDQWQSRTHVTRDAQVRLPFRGYRCHTAEGTWTGDRATPVLSVQAAAGPLHVAVPDFWQNFPRALALDEAAVTIGLFPDDAGDVHELQGGEQKTHTFVVACGDDPVSPQPLAWCLVPQRFRIPIDQVARAAAIPGLDQPLGEPDPAYTSLADLSLDPDRGFVAKRERADEYGWRHFGDLPADHESAFQPPDRPFVSHYNNQYDAVAGFACQFLLTGDQRWWRLMDDLARHVYDIDVYHTSDDKAAYNHGLFWHTNHYVDAGTSTHRTYPRVGSAGGGPSAEHNYNLGLMLHYFLTGDPLSRETAIALGQWVIDMDDGGLTPLRRLSRQPTGLADYTAGHHGPGRGVGHSILACIVAHRLSGERRFLDKAEALIRRTAAPGDPVSSVYVDDIEGYWSYTAFLQALGVYLDHKISLGECDAMAGWARSVLLTFARFMTDHERPYLERPDRLEFPTQTWTAQDLRKADVFQWAARHTDGADRDRFAERATFFFDHATTALPQMDGYTFTRPIVLVLTQGIRCGWLVGRLQALPPPVTLAPPPATARRSAFVPQRTHAVRRLAMLAATGVLVVLAVVIWWLLS